MHKCYKVEDGRGLSTSWRFKNSCQIISFYGRHIESAASKQNPIFAVLCDIMFSASHFLYQSFLVYVLLCFHQASGRRARLSRELGQPSTSQERAHEW